MRRYAYIGIVVLLLALLAGCRGDGGQDAVETPDTAEVSDSDTDGRPASVPLPDISQMPDLPKVSGKTQAPDSATVSDNTQAPETTEVPDSATVPDNTQAPVSATAPDSTQAPVSATVPDSTQAPVSATAPDSTQAPVSATAPDSTQAPDSATVSDTAQATDSATVSDTTQATDSGSTPTPEPRTLTADELREWTKFLCRSDCNGFLMSSFTTPLQADLLFVFYTGAGVGEYPSEEMVTDYLQANDLEEAYTDITFIPYDKASQVLERRTGYTLEHFKLAGNDIPMYYSQKYKGYFHMAGDTNYMPVECVSGRENPDGSLFLEVRESSEWSGDSACSFETTLKPDTTGQNMLFDQNTVTGGWLTWEED